jgi:hypothetical protein
MACNEDIVRRVEKLLNMTTDRGCTESEAAKAAGLAQKLMLMHDLTLGELRQDEVVGETLLDEMPGTMRQAWRGYLAAKVASHNGCTTLWITGLKKARLVVFGQPSDVQRVQTLYGFCARETERLARTAYAGRGRTWLNVWRHGVVDGIGASLREAKEAARQEHAASTGTALIVVDQQLAVIAKRGALARTFMHDRFRNIKKGGRNPAAEKDAEARERGYHDGRSLNVAGVGKALGEGK